MPEGDPESLADLFQRIEYIVGAPETVAEGLRRYIQEADVDRIDLMIHTPGMPQDALQRSMRLFAGEVAPLLGVEMGQPV